MKEPIMSNDIVRNPRILNYILKNGKISASGYHVKDKEKAILQALELIQN